MCKINGHSIFSYITQPWNSSKLYTSHQRANEVAAAQAKADEKIANSSTGDEISETASTAKINNKNRKSRTLNSLRVPLEKGEVGASVGSGSSLGLNLGG